MEGNIYGFEHAKGEIIVTACKERNLQIVTGKEIKVSPDKGIFTILDLAVNLSCKQKIKSRT